MFGDVHKEEGSCVLKNKTCEFRGPKQREGDMKRKATNNQNVGPESGLRRPLRLIKVGIRVLAGIDFVIRFLRPAEACETF